MQRWPDGKVPTTQEGAASRKEEYWKELSTSYFSGVSLAEPLLHWLFAAMEACWYVAIILMLAGTGVFGSHEAIISPWAPFAVLMLSAGLSHALERSSSQTKLFTGLLAIVIVLAIWSSLFALQYPLYNLFWILALINELLLLSPVGYHIVGLVIVLAFLCWRGLRIGRSDSEPESVYRMLKIGLGVILASVLLLGLRRLGGGYDAFLLLLIPLFLALAMVTHTLAYVVFMRRNNPNNNQGNVRTQERALFVAIGTVCALLLLVGLIFGASVSPEFLGLVQQLLSPIGTLYDLLAMGIAYLVVGIFSPIMWFLDGKKLPAFQGQAGVPTPPGSQQQHTPAQTPESVLAVIDVLRWVLPVLLLALIVLGIWMTVRVYKKRKRRLERDQEEHEGLWSWELFWTQLKALLMSLFGRRTSVPAVASVAEVEVPTGSPAALSVREIYRALLTLAARYGWHRKKNETPFEYQARLDQQLPQAEPHLESVTQAYASVRYGSYSPDEAELIQLRQAWQQLQQQMTAGQVPQQR